MQKLVNVTLLVVRERGATGEAAAATRATLPGTFEPPVISTAFQYYNSPLIDRIRSILNGGARTRQVYARLPLAGPPARPRRATFPSDERDVGRRSDGADQLRDASLSKICAVRTARVMDMSPSNRQVRGRGC